MVQYLRWMWRDAPRSLRLESLTTDMVVGHLAVATMSVLGEQTTTAAVV